jgi:hypothetical protein
MTELAEYAGKTAMASIVISLFLSSLALLFFQM